MNWNSTEYLRQCIASINEYTRDVNFELIVVDNASPDQDADSLTYQFENLRLIKSPSNIGFGRANNLGFRYSAGEYLLFLNPDTRLVSPAIDIMLAKSEALEDAGIVGCKLLNTDLTVQSSCIQTFPTILNQALDADFLRRRWPHSRLWGTSPLLSDCGTPAKVEVVSGACMMIRRDVFEQVGMFSEEYFMYAEDLDLCRKVVRAGFNNYYVGAATIIHHGEKQFPGDRDGSEVALDFTVCFEKSRVCPRTAVPRCHERRGAHSARIDSSGFIRSIHNHFAQVEGDSQDPARSVS